jgi:hypothetical protein
MLGQGGWLGLLLCACVPLLGCHRLPKDQQADPLDEIGRHLDAKSGHGRIHLSAYDGDLGDLVYAVAGSPTEPLVWQVVDGVDLSAPKDRPGGYRFERSDPGPDVGQFTSLALTEDGRPRIAYHDVTNRALKFASGPGTFATHTVESGGTDGSIAGLYARLLLDDQGVPTIAYMVTGLADGTGSYASELRVARAMSASPTRAADWKIVAVDRTRVPCGGLCPMGQACLMDAMTAGMPNGDPARSRCVATSTMCSAACPSGQACLGSTCTEVLGPPIGDFPEGIGLYVQLLRSASGALVLVYHDRTQGDLKLAREQPDGSFVTSFLDGNSPATDVGQFSSAALTDDGTLHVAYVDARSDELRYLEVAAGAATGMPTLLDDGIRSDGRHPFGAVTLGVVEGAPLVVYQDQATADLLVARRRGDWQKGALSTGSAGYGFYPRLLSFEEKPYVAQLVYDRAVTLRPLGRVALTPIP